jgi:hypothetical protein
MASEKVAVPDSVIKLERQFEQFRSTGTGRAKLPESLLLKPLAQGYESSKLLNEIAAIADVITDLSVTSDPCFPPGFSSSTNVGCGL